MNDRAQIPDGCELRLDLFLVSPSTALEVCVGISGMTSVPPLENLTTHGLALAKSLGLATGTLEDLADDWRMMSRDEVDDYKRRQEEEA